MITNKNHLHMKNTTAIFADQDLIQGIGSENDLAFC